VFGPRSTDMAGTRADALVALGQVVDPKAKKKLAIRSGRLEIAAAPGGHSAVAVDTAEINGEPHTVLAVLTNTDDLWLVGAVAVAHAPSAGQVKAELAKDAVVPPGAAGTRKIDPAAKPAVDKFQRGLLDQAAWGEELASHDGAIVVGPMAGEVARGKKEIKAIWKKRVEAKTRAAISGEITAAVTNDGQLAWVSAPITRVEGEGTQPLPLRAFAVYENDGGEWRLLALDESLAFGAPGAGASFKKVLPPRPAEPKPAEVVAAKPKDKETAKDKGKGKTEVAKDKPAAKKSKAAADEPDRKPARAKQAKDDEPDETPRRKKKKKRSFSKDDDADEAPKKKPPAKAEADEAPKKKLAKTDEADEAPPKKAAKKPAKTEEAAEAPPKKAAKKPAKTEEAAEEAPKKKSRSSLDAIDEDAPKKPAKKGAKPASKKQAKPKAEDAEEAPKKKPPAKADDDEIEVTE
jgi:ketosteroid isomerase-like protein